LESVETVHLLDSFDVVGPHQQLLFPLFGTKLTSLSVSIQPRESSRVPFTKHLYQSERLKSAISWSDTPMDIVKWPSLTSLTLNVAELYDSDNFDDADLIQLDIDVSHTCIPIIMRSTLSSSLSSLRQIHITRFATKPAYDTARGDAVAIDKAFITKAWDVFNYSTQVQLMNSLHNWVN
jgi:hypothetical protein